MQPHDIGGGVVVVDDLGSLDDPVGAQVSATLQGEELAHQSPLDQILDGLEKIRAGRGWVRETHGTGIAVDGLERAAVRVVLPGPVVDRVNFDDACPWPG